MIGRMLSKLCSRFRLVYLSYAIATRHYRHAITASDSAIHPLKATLFDALNTSKSGLFMHWGAYGAGKSVAAQNAALRLQNEGRRTVIMVDGDNLGIRHESTMTWVRESVGLAASDAHPLSAVFKRPTTIILDHFDLLLCDGRFDDTLACLRELARESAETHKFNVLLLLTSWERAIQLRDSIAESRIIASPSRWTADELKTLFESLPAAVKGKWTEPSLKKGCRVSAYTQGLSDLLRLAALAGTPDYLTFATETDFACPRKAAKLDREWRQGARAMLLSDLGEKSDDVGRFPDRNGIFHHA